MRKAVLWGAAVLFYLLALGCLLLAVRQGLSAAPAAGRLFALCGACLAGYLGSLCLAKGPLRRAAASVMRGTFFCFFLLYLAFLLQLTLFDAYFGRNGAAAVPAYNFMPLATISDYLGALFAGPAGRRAAVTNLLGNLAAFAPLAFFLPLLFARLRSFPRFLLAAAAIVALVELAQLGLRVGVCDVDDLLLNVGGACLLFALLRLPLIRTCVRRVTLLPHA